MPSWLVGVVVVARARFPTLLVICRAHMERERVRRESCFLYIAYRVRGPVIPETTVTCSSLSGRFISWQPPPSSLARLAGVLRRAGCPPLLSCRRIARRQPVAVRQEWRRFPNACACIYSRVTRNLPPRWALCVCRGEVGTRLSPVLYAGAFFCEAYTRRQSASRYISALVVLSCEAVDCDRGEAVRAANLAAWRSCAEKRSAFGRL